ncbi:unnamed protein product [Rotaria magnacalcarata]|uniref:Uncharacterized protein n=1 Tax=Rotaria magnacalcarata TaxID=392030 RepID=A0A814M811_9BILA|nr:unnamed protein product [Rotaria magnacalcarata]
MLRIAPFRLLFLLLVTNAQSLTNRNTQANLYEEQISALPDIEYEQVIAERYLFASCANESTIWPILTNIKYAWQAISLPDYHSQASKGVWLLSEVINEDKAMTSSFGQYQMSWMLLSANATLVVLSEINVNNNNSFLVSSHNPITYSSYSAALITPNSVQLVLCDISDATSCRIVQAISFPSVLDNITKINDGLFVEDFELAGWLYIASDSGLHGLNLENMTISPYIHGINVSVSSLSWSSKRQTIFAGTETKLWIQQYGNGNESWRFEHINAFIDAPITSLVYNDAQDKLWIAQNTGITLLSPVVMSTGRLHWYFSRLAGQISDPGSDIGHLPFANITKLSVSHSKSTESSVWLGGVYGVMRYDSNTSDLNTWRVFNSARYMPNRESQVSVSSIAAMSRADDTLNNIGSTAVAITNRGLAVLRFEKWTLSQKAEYFQNFLDQPGRHDKYGLVSGCSMTSWGDTRTCIKGPDDNDGLWTSMYLASQVFRYAVIRDPAIKSQAWKHFEALELLNQVSGILGYPGRSLAKRTDFPPDPNWHPSPIYSDLQFKGDTSSDEIVGHEFVYPLVHDLLAENDSERQRAYILAYNITNHILTHNWYLVGENHTYTTWGIWNPIQINDDSFYQESRGLNSLQILAFLLQTYAYSHEERFLDGAYVLVQSYQYDVNLINQKTIAVCDNSFSDDELAYLSYFTLVHAFQTIASSTSFSLKQKQRVKVLIDQLFEYMKIGLNLSHKYKIMEKSPFYNFIYCYVSGQVNQTENLFKRYNLSSRTSSDFDCNSLSNDGIWYMQRWPLELIDWQQFNSDRLDTQLNTAAQCNARQHSLQLLPPDERTSEKWNSDIYALEDGSGFNEDDPAAFLLSYWGMRYFNLLG